MKLYTKKSFLFLSQFILVAFFYSNTFSQGSGCDEPVATGTADGTFESLASVASSFGLNNNVTGGGWANGQGTADTWNSPLPNVTQQNYAAGMMPSPDGGVFAALWSSKPAGDKYESFNTVVNSLEVGRKYKVKFYQANAGVTGVGPPPPPPGPFGINGLATKAMAAIINAPLITFFSKSETLSNFSNASSPPILSIDFLNSS